MTRQSGKASRGALLEELLDAIRDNQSAVDQMDEAASRYMGINRTDGRCLDIIDRRSPIFAGDLARGAGLSTGAVTGVLDRLEARGFIRRLADPSDRRRVPVEITDLARRRAAEAYGRLAEGSGAALVDQFSDSEIEMLTRFLRGGAELNRRGAAEIRAELDRG